MYAVIKVGFSIFHIGVFQTFIWRTQWLIIVILNAIE